MSYTSCVLCANMPAEDCPVCVISKQQREENSVLAEGDCGRDVSDTNDDVMDGTSNNTSGDHEKK